MLDFIINGEHLVALECTFNNRFIINEVIEFVSDRLAVKSNSSKLNALSILVARIILRHPTGYYSHDECWPYCVVIEILAKSVISKTINDENPRTRAL